PCVATTGSTGPQTVAAGSAGTVTLNPDGTFTLAVAAGFSNGTTGSFSYCGNGNSAVSATVTFYAARVGGPPVANADTYTSHSAQHEWGVEQDLPFSPEPNCPQDGPGGTKPATCPAGGPPTLGTNFPTRHLPVVASGCTGPQSCERGQSIYDPATATHVPAVCDASGICVPAAAGAYRPTSTPDQAVLNATNPDGTPARYYLSILPGDAANSFNTGNTSDPAVAANCAGSSTPTGQAAPSCGHTTAGAPIAAPTCTAAGTCTFAPVTVNAQANPMKTATLTVFVFEDDFPINGEHDGNGAVEPGLGGFQVVLWDDAGSTGDPTGQMTYDMFNLPLTNSLN